MAYVDSKIAQFRKTCPLKRIDTMSTENYQELLDTITKSSRSFKEISLGSVEGNDYLFGDAVYQDE